ncbi:probable RPN5 - 26S proteasome regulatory subunit [Melanopsichium pennsylvanicum]|uniref:Probable RPN5 - 26S proteasome regulatory subunit n=2 Tax=Melanopsichium pennsylvanicum TaxID=63383 RepID=A0AAJ5C2T8_9BASI|nr:probable RPN5-26S proteasome regulatory subunit [Melanopsichium pennsylvanicum 4]SNX81901.1 probable RPN5 - 26S proteasome regulatory subunit [Melanopsichium pennsylvanicum]
MSAPEKKQEADFTTEVESLIPEAQSLASSNQLNAALEKVFALEKKSRNAADLTSTTRLLLLAILLVRNTPSPEKTNWDLLSDTVSSLSKKHGQLKMATTRMVQLVMCFLYRSVDPEEERRREQEAKDEEMKDLAAEKAKKEAEKAAKKEKDEGKKESKEALEARKRQEAHEEQEREKVGAQNAKVLELMDAGKRIGDKGVTEEIRLKIVELLRTVTEGKIFVEVERARVTLLLSKMLYAKGKIPEAADALQDLAVETFGSMDRREKAEFILEQMRLNYERNDLAKMAIVSKKINTKLFENPKHQDLKLRYYGLMIEYALREDKFLDICKYYREIYDTPSVKEDADKRKEALRNAIVFLALAKYDNEQSDLMARVEQMGELEQVAEHRNLLKCFTTPELMRWPGIETLYGPMLRQTATFLPTSTSQTVKVEDGKTVKDGNHRWEELHKRVVEHNIRVISHYYTRITLKRLSELLDLSASQSESSLADLVSSGTIYAKMDRPAGLVDFEKRKSNADVLNQWSGDMNKLMGTVEKVTHLVEKEWAVHRAGIRG